MIQWWKRKTQMAAPFSVLLEWTEIIFEMLSLDRKIFKKNNLCTCRLGLGEKAQ